MGEKTRQDVEEKEYRQISGRGIKEAAVMGSQSVRLEILIPGLTRLSTCKTIDLTNGDADM